METGVNEAKLLDDEEPAPKKIAGDSHGEVCHLACVNFTLVN